MERWKIEYFHLIIITANICLGAIFIKTPSTGRLRCKQNVTTDNFHRVKWFKSSRDDVFEKDGPALVSWDGITQPYTTDNYGIDEDYSLIIYNTSIHDEGVYRCQITRNVEPYSVVNDVGFRVYALPLKAPLIQRVNQTFISCSVDRVYPLLYPLVEFEHEEYAVSNTDGTYNTSVSGSIQDMPSESKAVSCSFPHFNYSHVSSLSLYPTTTPYGKDEQYPTTLSGLATTLDYPSPRANNTTLVFIILAVAAVFFFFSSFGLLLWRKYNDRRFHPPVKSAPVERNRMLHTCASGFAA